MHDEIHNKTTLAKPENRRLKSKMSPRSSEHVKITQKLAKTSHFGPPERATSGVERTKRQEAPSLLYECHIHMTAHPTDSELGDGLTFAAIRMPHLALYHLGVSRVLRWLTLRTAHCGHRST
ncbi:hypothetical protein B296_00051434 [Ensete ventricosum]|uniref:Uncharacterized protein n=1 Tax=Ensete ventricosum TaxID=4639 RepID=A0A426XMZ4_ENSVE|nr:hypothetical protein B296_00051434 [Ensete ventricosum]